jgi:hypothetical protein
MDVRKETSGETRRQQWNKGLRLKRAASSWKREDIGRIFRKALVLEIMK